MQLRLDSHRRGNCWLTRSTMEEEVYAESDWSQWDDIHRSFMVGEHTRIHASGSSEAFLSGWFRLNRWSPFILPASFFLHSRRVNDIPSPTGVLRSCVSTTPPKDLMYHPDTRIWLKNIYRGRSTNLYREYFAWCCLSFI